MQVAGIDGCRGGWIACVCDDGQWHFLLETEIEPLIKSLCADLIFIDIPIGLTDRAYERTVDTFARKELSPHRTSTVFTPPCREAIYCATYTEALEVNRDVTGKGISIQAWNISPKIRDAESCLIKNQEFRDVLHEAHPEICFKHCHDGTIVTDSKRSKKGQVIRRSILERHAPDLMPSLGQIEGIISRQEVMQDDIVDAAILAVSAMYARNNGIVSVGPSGETDSLGLPVRIGYGMVGSEV